MRAAELVDKNGLATYGLAGAAVRACRNPDVRRLSPDLEAGICPFFSVTWPKTS